MSKEIQNQFELISDLITFLNNPNLTVQDLSKYLTLKTFHSHSAYALYLMRLSSEANLELLDSFGQSDEQKNRWRTIPLSQEIPATDSVKQDRLIWLADEHDWDEFYPQLKNYIGQENLRTLINTPLYMTNAPIGMLGILSNQEHRPTPTDISFVKIVAGLVSLHISKQQSRNSQLEERGAYLTKRQVTILTMMSQQMTNMQIARELGYSESTIRHETMRIYEILQASGRREAVVIARKMGLIKPLLVNS